MIPVAALARLVVAFDPVAGRQRPVLRVGMEFSSTRKAEAEYNTR